MSELRKQSEGERDFVSESAVYQEFLAEREEILRHKWLESERLGYDIGFERALLDWIRKHRDGWRRSRRQVPGTSATPATGRMGRKGEKSDVGSMSPSN